MLSIVPAGHVYFDIAKAALRQMRLQRRERVRRFHIGNESHVDFRDGSMWQNRFAARASVATDQSFDVYSRLRFKPFVRLLPRQIVDPMLNGELFLGLRFAAHFDTFSIIVFCSALSGSGFG